MTSRSISVDQYLFLLGRPPIQDYIRFVHSSCVAPEAVDETALIHEWREASAHVRTLESIEAGIADTVDPRTLTNELKTFAENELESTGLRRHLQFLPYEWSFLDLDRLVVSQKAIDLTFIDNMKRRLPPELSEKELVRIALGRSTDPPAVDVTKINGNTYIFSSPSYDLRVLSTLTFDAEKVRNAIQPNGHAASVLGVLIGYGSNLLTAFRIGKRTFLLNGSHRAMMLRSLGVTHAPALVHYLSCEDDLDLIGSPELRLSARRHLHVPRPAIFKDYFDDRLRKILTVRRRNVVLEVQLNIRESRIPAL